MARTAPTPASSIQSKVIKLHERIRKECQSIPTRKRPDCPDKLRVRGYSSTDDRCDACRNPDDCQEKTLRRLLSVMDDLNRKLELGLYDEYWTYEGQADEVASKFDEWRDEIQEALVEWTKETDADEVRDRVKNLHGATLTFLDKTWPSWRKWSKGFIDNTHVTDTEDPEKLKWNLRMPYFILDSNMREMSGNAWKVLCYIARRTTFDPSHPHFGRCWLGYDEIKDWTGVKQPERQIKELEGFGLLKVVHVRRVGAGQIRTTNELTITWFQDFKKMGVDGYRNR